MTDLKLSVAMACYNKEDFVGKSIDSILAQSFVPAEIVIVDDASTDKSVEILEKYASSVPIIRLLRNDKNMGPMDAYNHAVGQCSSEYLYMMGCDDEIYPGFFEKSMEILAKYPDAVLCTSNPVTYYEDKEVYRITHFRWREKSCYLTPDELADAIQGWYISSHASIVKKSVLLETGMNLPQLKWHSDWFFWLVIAFRYGTCYVPEPLAVYRKSRESFTTGIDNLSDQQEVIKNILKEIKSQKFRDVLPYFCKGCVLNHLGPNLVNVVMSNPELWDIETMMLMQSALLSWNVNFSNKQPKLEHQFVQALTKEAREIFERGQTALKQGQFEEAHAVFTELVRVSPHFVDGYMALAKTSDVRGDLNGAIKALKEAVRIAPKNAIIYNVLGEIYQRNGDNDLAVEAYNQALILSPNDINIRMKLASMAQSQGYNDKAAEQYKVALDNQPNNVKLLVAAGKFAMHIKKYDVVSEMFNRALSLDSDCLEAQEGLKALRQRKNMAI